MYAIDVFVIPVLVFVARTIKERGFVSCKVKLKPTWADPPRGVICSTEPVMLGVILIVVGSSIVGESIIPVVLCDVGKINLLSNIK